MDQRNALEIFELAKPRLMGLAYRMLGSWADAEDAVQDTFLRWQGTDISSVTNPDAWLTTICTNRCLDILKSAHNRRVDYVGPWIPEPLHIQTEPTAESELERAETLTVAFLHMMERLTPKERAAFLLHSVFSRSHHEVAKTLDITEAASRQLVSRAGRHLQSANARFVPAQDHQEKILTAFLKAAQAGSVEQLSALLAEDVQFQSDGGGKATALGRVLTGPQDVAKYVARILSRLWIGGDLQRTRINGVDGFALYETGILTSVATFGFGRDGRIAQVFIVRNPDKLRGMVRPILHDTASGSLQTG